MQTPIEPLRVVLRRIWEWWTAPVILVDVIPASHQGPGDTLTVDVYHGPFQIEDSPYPEDGC